MNEQGNVLRHSAKFLTSLLISTLFTTLAACGGGGEVGGSTNTSSSSSSSSGSPSAPLASASYLVAWQPVNDPQVSGYKVYYSTAPFDGAVNPQTVTLGAVSSYTFQPGSVGITAGSTVYVAVAAFSADMESPLSDQATIVVQ